MWPCKSIFFLKNKQITEAAATDLDAGRVPGDVLLQSLQTLLQPAHVEETHRDVVTDHLGLRAAGSRGVGGLELGLRHQEPLQRLLELALTHRQERRVQQLVPRRPGSCGVAELRRGAEAAVRQLEAAQLQVDAAVRGVEAGEVLRGLHLAQQVQTLHRGLEILAVKKSSVS